MKTSTAQLLTRRRRLLLLWWHGYGRSKNNIWRRRHDHFGRVGSAYWRNSSLRRILSISASRWLLTRLARELIGNIACGGDVRTTAVARGWIGLAITMWRIHALTGSSVRRNIGSGSRNLGSGSGDFGSGAGQNVGPWTGIIGSSESWSIGSVAHVVWPPVSWSTSRTSSALLTVMIRWLLVYILRTWRWWPMTVLLCSGWPQLIYRPRCCRRLLTSTSHNQYSYRVCSDQGTYKNYDILEPGFPLYCLEKIPGRFQDFRGTQNIFQDSVIAKQWLNIQTAVTYSIYTVWQYNPTQKGH